MSRSTSPTIAAPSVGLSCFLATRREDQPPVALPPRETNNAFGTASDQMYTVPLRSVSLTAEVTGLRQPSNLS